MAAQIKKYDPNQYNFEDFAKTMNQNFAIERAQNGQGGAFGVNAGVNAANPVNLGGTTNSQTLGNLNVTGNNLGETLAPLAIKKTRVIGDTGIYSAITLRYKDVIGGLDKGQPIQYNTPTYETVEEKVSSAVPGNQWGAGEADVYPDASTLGENYNAIIKAVGEYGKSQGVSSFKITDENINDVREYLTSLGYSRQDINGVVNREGGSLSWSYAPTQQEEITNEVNDTLKTGKLDYETWRSTYSVDPAVEYQNAQAQLDYEFQTWMSTYGARAEQLYQMGLSNSGVSDIYGANAYSAYMQASMDLKRAQIAQEKENKALYAQYSAEYDAQQSSMTSAAFNAYAATYTPDQEQSIRVALEAQGLTAEQVEKVIGDLNAYFGGGAGVQSALSWMSQQYAAGVTDIDTLVTQAASIYGEDTANLALEKFTPFVNNGKKISNPAIQEAYLSYVGSYDKAMADTITADLQNLGWSDEDISTLIGMLDKAVDAQTESLIDKEIKDLQGAAEVYPLAKSFDQIVSDVSQKRIEKNTGDISSSQFDRYLSATSNLLYEAMKSLESPEDLKLAYSLIGMDEQAWNSYDSWEGVENDDQLAAAQLNALLEKYSSLHAQGIVSDENYRVIIEDWFRDEINTAIEDDTDDAMASGLGKIGAAITTLKQYAKLGKMNDSLYNALINIAASEFDVTLKNKKVKLTWGNSGSDATLKLAQFTNWNNNVVKGEAAKKIAEIDNNAEGPFVTYNDKLYMRSDKATEWLIAILGIGLGNTGLPQTYEWIKHLAPDSYIEIKPEEIMVLGEGGKTMDYSKEGIYEMLKIWSSPKK